jgi:hypothetical protein
VILAFLCGVTNGYVWNSRWTFRESQRDARKQAPKFLATNTVGSDPEPARDHRGADRGGAHGPDGDALHRRETLRLVFERKTQRCRLHTARDERRQDLRRRRGDGVELHAAKFFTFKA